MAHRNVRKSTVMVKGVLRCRSIPFRGKSKQHCSTPPLLHVLDPPLFHQANVALHIASRSKERVCMCERVRARACVYACVCMYERRRQAASVARLTERPSARGPGGPRPPLLPFKPTTPIADQRLKMVDQSHARLPSLVPCYLKAKTFRGGSVRSHSALDRKKTAPTCGHDEYITKLLISK